MVIAPRLAEPVESLAGCQRLHTGPVVARTFRLFDDAGQLWEGTDIDEVRGRVGRENLRLHARLEEMAAAG